MAIETASTNSGLTATINNISTNQANLVIFAAIKPLNNVNTWGRFIALHSNSADNPYARIRIRGDATYEAQMRDGGASGGDVTALSTAAAGTWHRVVLRYRSGSTQIAVRTNGVALSTASHPTAWVGSGTVNRLHIDVSRDLSTFGTGARYAHLGYYLGDWSDTEIQDFCAGTWNQANSGLATDYWTGDSLTSEIGGKVLSQAGSNNATIVSDTGHGVPDYSGGSSIKLSQVERGAITRGLNRGLS